MSLRVLARRSRPPQARCSAVELVCMRRSFNTKTPLSADAHGVSYQSSPVTQTLAIETSCDDTSVAILRLERDSRTGGFRSRVLFHDKVTAKSEPYGGIHPLIALHSHQTELGPLVQRALAYLEPEPSTAKRQPDFVTVTRGPGMRSNLSVGLDTAKGLALAWGKPLLGVHHMQAHALTPRLCSSLKASDGSGRILYRPSEADDTGGGIEWTLEALEPRFPFLGLLVSGGHTMLIDSQSLYDHTILAETGDIALGDCLDKAARNILPADLLRSPYGKALEDFAFPDGCAGYAYSAPRRRQEELERRHTRWGWSLGPPLGESKGGFKTNKRMAFSFAGILTAVNRFMTQQCANGSATRATSRSAEDVSLDERRELARELMRIAFEHLGSRILLHLASLPASQHNKINSVVVSGGVASNRFLRHVLRDMLDVRGYQHVKLEFPPVELCTDNALMIAWAGMEMYLAGFQSESNIRPLRNWSMDPRAEDGGILGVGGWQNR